MNNANVQGRFAGVAKIIRFNVQFYVLSAASLAGASLVIASKRLPSWAETMTVSIASIIAFWTVSSLLVSWYVYDHSAVTRWKWLPGRLPQLPQRWANIHAGLDESTFALRQLMPGTEGSAVDIYDPGEMTESSIARARRIHPASELFQRGTYDAIGLAEKNYDAVFLLFAAHEVRNEQHRMRLLRQTTLVLREKGYLVLVEHLRDWRNFISFGPGFFHFYSRRNWLRNIREAGLVILDEGYVTPFVKCFVLRRAEP